MTRCIIVKLYAGTLVARAIVSAALAAVVLSAVPAAAKSDDASARTIVVEISELKNRKGTVRCALHKEDNWLTPEKAEDKGNAEFAPDGSKAASCRFADVAPGTYAVAVFHDEDDDGKLDTNWIGIPSEGTCTSNNVIPRMGPPKFSKAKFRYDGKGKTLRVKMRY